MARHCQLVSEAGQSLIPDKADDVQLAQQPSDTVMVESFFGHGFVAILFEAAASKTCAEVRHKVVLIVLSVV